jgi:Fe-S cluster assembly iron-binding protein IscA
VITINDIAKSKIVELLDKNPGKYLRIVVEGDGCAGPYLGLSLDEARDNDIITKIDGIDFLVSDEVRRHAEITTINIFLNHTGKDSL